MLTTFHIGKVVNFFQKSSVIPTSFLLKQNFWMTSEWRNEVWMTGMKSRKTSFFPVILDDRNDWYHHSNTRNDWNHHSDIIPVIPTKCHSVSFQCQNDHGMNEMTAEWQYISNMNYDWWNDIQMVEWHPNDGINTEWARNAGMTSDCYYIFRMTFAWRNDIQMMEWHPNDGTMSKWALNDGMTYEWWNDIQMMEWHPNDEIMSEWPRNDGVTSDC